MIQFCGGYLLYQMDVTILQQSYHIQQDVHLELQQLILLLQLAIVILQLKQLLVDDFSILGGFVQVRYRFIHELLSRFISGVSMRSKI